VFLTWRLHGSLPLNRTFPTTLSSGQAFAAMDRLLDQTRAGPLYLRQPALADMIVEAIRYGASVLGHYTLHAFVVMPNHVHLLVTPAVALRKLTKSLKGITAKRANAMLALTGGKRRATIIWSAREVSLKRSCATSKRIRFARDWRQPPTDTDGLARVGRPGGRLRTRGSAPPCARSLKYCAPQATTIICLCPAGLKRELKARLTLQIYRLS
jgi:hypothetical protein